MFKSQISFLYYKDLNKAIDFYEKVFGFDLINDQGWAKIYKVTETANIGLVDETKGYFNWEKNKTVMITLVVNTAKEVDDFYSKLKSKQIDCLTEPKDIEEINIRAFLFEDPEGYVIEVQYFYQ